MRDLHEDSDFTYEQFKPAGGDIALPVTLPVGTIFVSSVNGITGSITFAGGTTGLTFTPAGATISLGGILAVANGGTGTTASTGTGSVVLASSPTLTTPNVVGTATNNNAAAGSVGELISATLVEGSAVSLTTATAANITSVNLTAGDWDVSGVVAFKFAGTTSYTILTGGTNSTSATIGAIGTYANNVVAANVPGAVTAIKEAPITRYSLSATTTVYLIAYAAFTVSTLQAYGFIRARRVR